VSRDKRPTASSELAATHLQELLAEYISSLRGLSPRQRVLKLIDLQASFRRLGKAVVAEAGFGSSSARGRIKQYLTAHRGSVIEGAELAVVGGISEYARRARELRAQGLEILTGPDVNPMTGHRLRPDHYLYLEGARVKDNLFRSTTGNEKT